MGNWAKAILTIHTCEKSTVEEINNFLENKNQENGWYCWELNEYFDYKWPEDLYRELTELSLQFPDVVFKLHEDWDDYGSPPRNSYFKNGKVQHCQTTITFEEYNEEKLVLLHESN